LESEKDILRFNVWLRQALY